MSYTVYVLAHHLAPTLKKTTVRCKIQFNFRLNIRSRVQPNARSNVDSPLSKKEWKLGVNTASGKSKNLSYLQRLLGKKF